MKESRYIVSCTLDGLTHPEHGSSIELGMVKMRTSDNGSDMDRIFQVIKKACLSGDYDLIVAPEYNFLPKKGPLSLDEMTSYAEELAELSNGRGTVLVPGTFVWKSGKDMANTALVLHGGELKYHYTKMRDGGESGIAQEHGLNPVFGKQLGVFELLGYKWGIEICADMGSLSSNGVKNLDISLMVSCGISSVNMNPVREGGYGIVVDGNQVFCNVKKKGWMSSQNYIKH